MSLVLLDGAFMWCKPALSLTGKVSQAPLPELSRDRSNFDLFAERTARPLPPVDEQDQVRQNMQDSAGEHVHCVDCLHDGSAAGADQHVHCVDCLHDGSAAGADESMAEGGVVCVGVVNSVCLQSCAGWNGLSVSCWLDCTLSSMRVGAI